MPTRATPRMTRRSLEITKKEKANVNLHVLYILLGCIYLNVIAPARIGDAVLLGVLEKLSTFFLLSIISSRIYENLKSFPLIWRCAVYFVGCVFGLALITSHLSTFFSKAASLSPSRPPLPRPFSSLSLTLIIILLFLCHLNCLRQQKFDRRHYQTDQPLGADLPPPLTPQPFDPLRPKVPTPCARASLSSKS